MAASDLTTLANVKQWVNLTATTDDALLTRLISGVSLNIQAWLNRNIPEQSYTEIRSGLGGGEGKYRMILANYPVIAVSSLMIDDQSIPASSDNGVMQPGYGFADHEIWLAPVSSSVDALYSDGYQFTRGTRNVQITYTAGYPVVPLDIEQACIELVAFRYRERDRIGLKSKGLAGETTAFNTADLPDSVKTLLQQYRKVAPI